MKSSVPEYIQNPMLPLTITVIGAGGSGSLFLQRLARMVYAYQELYHRRIVVVVTDGDVITASNVGRQAYGQNEVMQSKAQVIVSRINRFYGFQWLARPLNFQYPANSDEFTILRGEIASNFIVTAVDNKQTRDEVFEFIKALRESIRTHEWYPHFWIDMGNTKTTGNVIVESEELGWPSGLDVYKDNYVADTRNEPSCSLAMALNEQDLFINDQCSLVAAKWLWECLTAGNKPLTWRGAFINLDSLTIRKLKVDVNEKRDSNKKQQAKPRRQSTRTRVRARSVKKR